MPYEVSDTLPVLLTVPQVMHETGFGRTFVYELIGSGKLRSLKVGKSRRVPADALREFVQESLASSGVDAR
jgi:excisionase family DNA binding protein